MTVIRGLPSSLNPRDKGDIKDCKLEDYPAHSITGMERTLNTVNFTVTSKFVYTHSHIALVG